MKSCTVYNEEEVRLPEIEQLKFGCTCSRERCANALIQIGVDAVHETLEAKSNSNGLPVL
jgi:molecular chaperone Hsp33